MQIAKILLFYQNKSELKSIKFNYIYITIIICIILVKASTSVIIIQSYLVYMFITVR